MNDTDYDEHGFYMDFTLMAEEIWIAVSALINVSANVLMLYCLYKVGLKSATNVAIFNLGLLDIIQLLTCPVMYKIFVQTHDILEEFEAHSIFTNLFFNAMYGILLCFALMILKMHFSILERKFNFIIIGMWIILIAACVGGYFGYYHYYRRAIFTEIYILLFIGLFIITLIEQMISTINLGNEKILDHKISLMLALFFLTVRICLPIIFVIGSLLIRGPHAKTFVYIVFGLLPYNSIANLLLLAHMDRIFRNIVCDILRIKKIMQNNNVNFVNLPEETVNILDEE